MSARAGSIAATAAYARDERYYRYSRILGNVALYGLCSPR
jgi:hypothetical protein